MNFSTRITDLLGIRYPILQAGMSWASSNAELALAVSQAGALGVISAGPMYPDALRDAIRAVKAQTDRPFAVNVPLYNPRAATFLDIVIEERVPIIVASQGGPRQHIARFKQHGVTWLHVTAPPNMPPRRKPPASMRSSLSAPKPAAIRRRTKSAASLWYAP